MSDLSDRIAELSPEKRALLTMRLKQKRAEAMRGQAIQKREDLDSYPLSFAQQRMWFLNQWEPDSPFYNINAAVRLSGHLDIAALEGSLNEIVRRHEVLRAHFEIVNGLPEQWITSPMTLNLPLTDLRSVSKAEREVELQRLATQEARRPFDLSSGPLIRASLLKLSDGMAEEHVVLLTMHHIVSDGWSMGVFVREVAMLYEAFAAGKNSPLLEMPIQYADFAHWQRNWLRGEIMDTQLEYWRNQLAGSPPILELITDKPRPAVQTYNGTRQSFQLSGELTQKLKALSQQEGVTLYMTLLAAFQVLLYRYTGQEDINLGSPIAGRSRAELEGLIGFFVNTLVLRADLSGEPSFREFLGRVRETVLGALAHQDIPFETLVDELKVARDMSHTPLFQVMFALQDTPLKAIHTPGLKLSLLDTDSGTAKNDLILFMEEGPDGLQGALEYNTDLFNDSTISRILANFSTLLESIVTAPDQQISRLQLMSEDELHQLLIVWNDTLTDYPQQFSIAHLFEERVEGSPESEALVFGKERLTYRELNQRANQLAHYLRKLGVGPEVLVGVFMERSLEMVVTTLGIIKAGGAYLPLDLGYPQERIAFMLEDGQVPVLLTLERFLDDLPSQQSQIICVDKEAAVIAAEREDNPEDIATSENLAYVIYTSGSTGIPKGVCIRQKSILRLVFNTNYIELTASDRVAHASNPSFDAATFEIWGALLHGAQLVGISRDTALSAHAFVEALKENRISALFITTALFNHIAGEEPSAFQTLKQVMFGGEAVDPRWVRVVLQNDPPERLVHVYGPTETTTFATWFRVEHVPEEARTVPIGYPLSNTTLYVLDRNQQPVPIGVPGELYIGGDGVARGYLKRPELTREKFIPDPFVNTEIPSSLLTPQSSFLYRTGDLVRYLPDGSVEFLGRIDTQVKLRGFRIELGEIETRLGAHPVVLEAAVLAREDTPGDRRLVAYIVPDPNSHPKVEDLRGFLREKLPEYMVPSAFMFLDALPINPNGKLDRRALPVPDHSRPELEKKYVAPRTPLEQYLVRKWQEILGINQVGVYDNFFELGGDSLQAAVFTNRIQEELGEIAHVRALFMAPSIAELAVYMMEYYPDAVAKIGGENGSVAAPTVVAEEILEADRNAHVTAVKLARFCQIIRPLSPRDSIKGASSAKNPPAIFILSPPRSGSTLLRTMLAGNPRLFSPPELDLLSFNTLAERCAAFSGKYSFWLEGVLRAIMEIRGCDADQAQKIMDDFENQGMTTQEFYHLLQEWIAERWSPPKILVDKTPVYSLDMEILKRAEEDFEQPLYIHLTRHPYASIYSFVEAKLDRIFFRYEHPFAQRELAEMVWIVSHQNIMEFLQGIPRERQLRLTFEDLVSQPEEVMQNACRFLDIDYTPEMVKPYEGKRMTSGVRPGAQMVGDFKFYLRKDIDPGAADRWKKFQVDDFLSQFGWEIAGSLGYEKPDEHSPRHGEQKLTQITKIPRDGELPLSFAQQRLWFLDQWEPGNSSYNVPMAVRMTGDLKIDALERSLNEIVRRHEVLRTTFHTLDGRPAQKIASHLELAIPVVDLRDIPADERETEALRLAAREVRRPFDLSRGPLLRAHLLRLDKDVHIFVLNMHHIISDGWSSGVFIREIATLYPVFREGKASPLSELPIQYVDYANWQRQWLKEGVQEEQFDYWKRQLANIPPILELPTDRPRPAVQTLNGAQLPFELSIELSERIRAFSQQTGSTLYITLLAAFQTLLYRYTGQEDICVGTPIANRTRVEIEGLIGFFVNTLVLRSDLSGDPSFKQLLERVQKVAVEAYDHQDLPFEMLVDELHPGRDMSHTPLFQVMFTLQDAPIQALELPGLTLQPLNPDSGTAKFDLLLTTIEKGDILKGVMEYNTDLFDAVTIQRMIEHFRVLLEAIVEAPDQAISRLPLLTEIEERQLLGEWNDTFADYPGDQTLHQLFEQQVERTPLANAVVYGTQHLTFQELNRRANQLGHYLRGLGVGPEVLVGLCVERSVDMLVGILGILKAGGAYLPLDPDYPQERLEFMLEDAQVTVVITQEPLLSTVHFPLSTSHLLCLDRDWPAIAQESGENLESGVTAENLAYVIYTSGSTGKPKGAMIEHHSVINLWAGLSQAIYANHPGEALRVSLNAPLPFDASVQEWIMLLSGHTLYVIPQDVRLDGAGLLNFIRENRLDVLDCVPSQLKLLIASGLLDGTGWTPGAILPGGEAIDEQTWAVLAQAERVEFYNMYGPTECAVDSTICRVKEYPGRPSIGRPIGNARLYVLDRQLQPVPPGVPGELYIGGEGVGRGYLNRPELTSERFIANPFVNVEGGMEKAEYIESGAGDHSAFLDQHSALLYKTGDLVRYLPDGYVEFLGRIDHQVKVRGFRIELGEIETALLQHPAVRGAVVLAREDVSGEKQLVAYLVANLATDLKSVDELWHAYSSYDRRSEVRVNVRWPCTITLKDGRSFAVSTGNLSYQGILLLDVPITLEEGQTLDVSLSLPEIPNSVSRQGRVVWVDGTSLSLRLETTSDQYLLLEKGLRRLAATQEVTVFDRRKSEFRVPLNLACRIQVDQGEPFDLSTQDLSATGLRLGGVPGTVTTGKIMNLAFRLPDTEEEVALDGKVAWRNGEIVGVQFDSRAVDEQRRIRDYLSEYVARKKLTVGDLRAFLKEKLPDYMIPSIFVMLDEIPLTPNGKVNRRALPKPEGVRPELDAEYVAPRTPQEEALARIWGEVLGLEKVGVYDNFFELGGDSILSIQVIARANHAGLRLTPRQLFEAQTVADLAAVAGILQVAQAEQGLVTGEVPLTPIQRHFFEQDLIEPQYWNQALLLEVKQALDASLLEESIRQLLIHHDALRLRFRQGEEGWKAVNTGVDDQVPFERIDLSGMSPLEQGDAIRREATRAQANLDLERGPLMRVVYFDLGEKEAGRLLIVIHHLVVDGVSWRILLEDLQSAYHQLSEGRAVQLPPKTTSFQEWARQLEAYAQTVEVNAELEDWLNFSSNGEGLPVDFSKGENLESSVLSVKIALSPEETQALLQDVPSAYHTEINDVLLTALVKALGPWTGKSSLLLGLEGHGREDILEGVDVSRTVGWFTSLYPVSLELKDSPDPGEVLKAVKEQLRRVPRRGIEYGLLRYLSREDSVVARLKALPEPGISFNYLGQVDRALPPEAPFGLAQESSGSSRSPKGRRSYLLDITGSIAQGQLRLEWMYSENLHQRETIERLAQKYMDALRALISHCQSPEAGGYTPSDFPDADLGQEDLEALMTEINEA